MSKPHEIVKTGLSLAAFFKRYPTDTEAETQFECWRWPTGPVCPHCDSDAVSVVKSRRPQPYRCRSCRRHFSFKTDTPMHDSKLGAQTWLLGLFLIVANPKGRSSVQLAADLGITQKSAWHVSHRVRRALADGCLPGFDGPIQVDEAWFGGKAKNRHRRHRDPGKTPVIVVVDNATGEAIATPVHEVNTTTATAMVQAVAAAGTEVHTDGSRVYDPLGSLGYDHQRVLHSIGEYVRADGVTTNSAESYWALLKRTYIGTYHYWSAEHCHRYVEEHNFRFNNRSRHVTDRMADAAARMNGRRLPWRELVADGPHAQRQAA